VKDEVTDEEWSGLWDELYRQYPFGQYISLARKDRLEADTAWFYNVMGRIPPGQRTAAFRETGVSDDILDKLWATDTESGVPRLEQLDEADRMRIVAATLELAQHYNMPTPAMTAEWDRVGKRNQQMYDAIERQFPGVLELEDRYYQLKDSSPYEADVLLEQHPELEAMWDYRTQYRRNDPLLMWYYGPAARDQAIDYIWDVYFSLNKDNGSRSRLVRTMGQDFEDLFLSKKYNRISDAQLFAWAAALDGLVYYTQKDMPEDWQGLAPRPEEMLAR
jgi:hypothetical protein